MPEDQERDEGDAILDGLEEGTDEQEPALEEMPALTRDAIIAAKDEEREWVAVPEWGGRVRVRGLTGAERDEYEQEITRLRDGQIEPRLRNSRAKLLIRSVIDDSTGTPLFTDTDIGELAKKSAKAVNRVFVVAARLSGLRKQDMEQLVKGFDKPRTGSSASA